MNGAREDSRSVRSRRAQEPMTAIKPHEIWSRLEPELAAGRQRFDAAMQPGNPNTFTWQDAELWVDRRRGLVLDTSTAADLGALSADTAPDSRRLEFRGGRHSSTRPRDLVAFLASVLSGRGAARTYAPRCAEWLGLAVAQPRINPAFESLLWLGLETEVRPASQPTMEIAARIGLMAYDLAKLPGDREAASEIRAAQIEFIRDEFDPRASGESFDRDRWLAATDEEWAAFCAEVRRVEIEHLEIEIAGAADRL
jgi:hypothetical protein